MPMSTYGDYSHANTNSGYPLSVESSHSDQPKQGHGFCCKIAGSAWLIAILLVTASVGYYAYGVLILATDDDDNPPNWVWYTGLGVSLINLIITSFVFWGIFKSWFKALVMGLIMCVIFVVEMWVFLASLIQVSENITPQIVGTAVSITVVIIFIPTALQTYEVSTENVSFVYVVVCSI